MADSILSRSVPLEFTLSSGRWYAGTPRGEFGWDESCGLYEWRRLDGEAPSRVPGLPPVPAMVRIHYSGGDRQASRNGQMLHAGPESPGRDVSVHPYPHVLGFQAALSPVRMN